MSASEDIDTANWMHCYFNPDVIESAEIPVVCPNCLRENIYARDAIKKPILIGWSRIYKIYNPVIGPQICLVFECQDCFTKYGSHFGKMTLGYLQDYLNKEVSL